MHLAEHNVEKVVPLHHKKESVSWFVVCILWRCRRKVWAT